MSQDNTRAISAAAYNGTLEELKAAIETSVPKLNAEKMAYYFSIVSHRGKQDMMRYLLESGATMDFDSPPYDEDRSVAIFQLLFDYGWDVNGPSSRGNTPLAMVVDDEELVRWFLDHGAERSIEKHNESVVGSAAGCGTINTLQLLLDHGAKLEGTTALQEAANSEIGIPMMEFILNKGFDINALAPKPKSVREYLGTALHTAARFGHPDRVKYLLDRGADRNIRIQYRDMTPAEWALRFKQQECYELLKEDQG